MEERREGYRVLETKLDILIGDFQDFKAEKNKETHYIMEHLKSEETNFRGLLTTVEWHTIIGSFIVGLTMLLLYKEYIKQ